MEVSIDIADALQEALNETGHESSATPLPEDFEDRLPYTRVEALGGQRTQLVLDTFNIHIDTWAETPAEAIAEANRVASELTELTGTRVSGSQVYSVTLGSLPYEAEDPDHPSLPMASFMAQVAVRTRHV